MTDFTHSAVREAVALLDAGILGIRFCVRASPAATETQLNVVAHLADDLHCLPKALGVYLSNPVSGEAELRKAVDFSYRMLALSKPGRDLLERLGRPVMPHARAMNPAAFASATA
ncbi:hypothetical protein [Geopseudomonas aromaticivorans]